MLATSDPGINVCGASETGYMSPLSVLPMPGQTNNITTCIHYGSSVCDYEIDGMASNCGDYFVYYLTDVTYCTGRYCGQ